MEIMNVSMLENTSYCPNGSLANSCSALNISLTQLEEENCSLAIQRVDALCNCTNHGTIETNPDLVKAFTIIVVVLVSLVGNICTIATVSCFKVHKVPDILVIGLAMTDLYATLVPITMAMYAYFAGISYTEGCILCNFFGTMAQFTRYSSAQIVTTVSLERYLAVNRPFIYRKYATPKRFILVLIASWLIAFALAVVPLVRNNTSINTHDGFCLFDLTSYYAIAILMYSAVQYVTVFLCFTLVSIELIMVYRRRKKLKVQGKYNTSRAHSKNSELTFTKPNLTSRISDLGKSLKKAAPIITEKFQWSVEAQFARMFFAVVALFYISWTTIVLIIIIAQIKQSSESLDTALFWGIRITIISTAINPLLYGILARQYRLAYFYLVRLLFSKCCYCISPPLKDVFSAIRGGGDNKSRRDRAHSLGTQGGSYYSRQYSEGALSPQTKITLPPNLHMVREELSVDANESSIGPEFSMHVASAGELTSTASIPHQVKAIEQQMRGAVSLDDLVDSGLVELGKGRDVKSGVQNPLAVMTKMVNGKEVIVSPVGSDMDSETVSPDPFSNPVYKITNGSSTTLKTREQMEAEIYKHQNMLASSSKEDITLISKKQGVTKTRSHDLPYQPSRFPGTILSFSHQQLHPPLHEGVKTTGKKSGLIPATDIDSGRTVMVASRENLSSAGSSSVQSPVHLNGIKVADQSNVSKIKEKFEMFSSTPTPHQSNIKTTATQSHSHTRTGYQNSTGSSDSGRDSMILESDTVPVIT